LAALNTAIQPVVVARAKRVPLTGTAATTVLSATARKTSLFALSAYASVANAQTNLTLQATWTDPDTGNPQTYTWLNNVAEPVGVYPQNTIIVAAKGGTALSIVATAGTANNIKITGTIEQKD
jgi:hypothetical protein